MSDIGSYGPSGETPAGKGYLNVHDYAQMETRGLVMGDGGEGYLLIDGNGKVTSTGNQWLRFGFFPTGVFEGELKDNATLHGTGAMYLGDDRGTANLVGALRRTMALTGCATVKELQKSDLVVHPHP